MDSLIIIIILVLIIFAVESVFRILFGRKCPKCRGDMYCVYEEQGLNGAMLFSVWQCSKCGHAETIDYTRTKINKND